MRVTVAVGTTRTRAVGDVAATSAATLNPVSQDTTASDAAARGEGAARGKWWWVRWVVLGIAVVVLGVELGLVWDQLARAWHSVLSANWWWVLAAVAAATMSMHSFAQIQRTLLRSAGVKV